MTAVDTRTGEITSTPEIARIRADRIRADFPTVAAWSAAVTLAYVERDWAALDYPSWETYLAGEYGEFEMQLPRSLRLEVVARMSAAQMSSRAIAAAVGVSHATVQRDQASGGTFVPPDAADECDPDAEIVDAELLDEEPPAPKPITGMDGKTYPKLTRPAPGRSPFTGEFYEAVEKVRKAINALAKTTQDDRFTRNADQVAATYRSDLIRAQDALAGVIEQLPTTRSLA